MTAIELSIAKQMTDAKTQSRTALDNIALVEFFEFEEKEKHLLNY